MRREPARGRPLECEAEARRRIKCGVLDRNELSQVKVLDRETDPKNPTYHALGDQEQQRILINTMIGAAKLDVPKVQERLRWLLDNDPSPRVRAAAREVLGGRV